MLGKESSPAHYQATSGKYQVDLCGRGLLKEVGGWKWPLLLNL